MQCLKCGYNYPKLKENLCKQCYEYAIWKGDIGPGKLCKQLIKKINKGK